MLTIGRLPSNAFAADSTRRAGRSDSWQGRFVLVLFLFLSNIVILDKEGRSFRLLQQGRLVF